jgi:hypothetical protein
MKNVSDRGTKLIKQHATCPTVRDVQSNILAHLKDAADRVDAKLFYADLVLTPRPVVWFCGTYEQTTALQDLLSDAGLNLVLMNKGKIQPFKTKIGGGYTGVVYENYSKDRVNVHGITSGVEVEFCTWSDDRQSWRAPRAKIESEADVTYLDGLEDVTYLDVSLPMLRNCYEVWQNHPSRTKVDLVYTWVDGNDPDWRARKAAITHEEQIFGANADARFVSGTELLFSVISAMRYFADLGDIYIVTDSQEPKILGDLLSKVKIVDHKDIFDDHGCLPTFNSHAIGAQLHNIPGLRKHYLYLNDDVLFGRPTSASTFYDEIGRSYQFQSTAVSTPHTKVGKLESAVDSAARNNRQLLQEKFGVYAFRKFKHTPVAVDRDVMMQMRQDLPEAWDKTVGNQFRSPEDHAIAGHLYAHYATYMGKSVVGLIRYAYFDLGRDDFKARFSTILKRDWRGLDTFCVNETKSTPETASNRAHMNAILQRVYPTHGIVSYPLEFAGSSGSSEWSIREVAKRILPDFMKKGIRKVLGRMRASNLF